VWTSAALVVLLGALLMAPATSLGATEKAPRHAAKRCAHGRLVHRRVGKGKNRRWRWVCVAKRAPRRHDPGTAGSKAKNPQQTPAPSSLQGPALWSLTWNGDLSTGNFSQYTPYPGAIESCQNSLGMISVVANPHPDTSFSGAYAARFDVSDQAVHANCPFVGSPGHPNSNLDVGRIRPDSDFFVGLAVYLPGDFPPHVCWDDSGTFIPSCWMQLMEIYGAPYRGPSPISLDVLGATYSAGHTNQIILNGVLGGVSLGSPGTIWRSPPLAVTGEAWQTFVVHVHLSRCGGVTPCAGGEAPGFVELWYDGAQQQFFDGSTRAYYATLDQANYCAPGTGGACGYDTVDFQQYRGNEPSYTTGSTGLGSTYSPTYPGQGTISDYLGGARFGTSYAAVAPH
jgi:hypothetical protein